MQQYWTAAVNFWKPDKQTGRDGGRTHSALTTPLNASADILPVKRAAKPLYEAGTVSPPKELFSLASDRETTKTLTPEVPKETPKRETVKNQTKKPKVNPAAAAPITDNDTDNAAPIPDEEDAVAAAKSRASRYGRSTAQKSKRMIEPDYDGKIEDEPIAAKAAVPIYPSLIQLPGVQLPAATGAAPAVAANTGVVQTNYTAPSAASSAVPAVAASLHTHGAGDWQPHIRAGIEQLRFQIEQIPNGRTTENEMRLRMLEMLLGNRTEAAKPIQTADKAMNEFLGHQVLGLAALMDGTVPDQRSRCVSAAYQMSEGLSALQNLCPIKFNKAVLVSDWIEFGRFIPRTEDYKPGEMFVVYLELENLTVRRSAENFDICASLSYEILDESSKVVATHRLPEPLRLKTQSRKRDYCLHLEGFVPKGLAPGQYKLRICMTDLNDDAAQFAMEQILLKVGLATTSTKPAETGERNRLPR